MINSENEDTFIESGAAEIPREEIEDYLHEVMRMIQEGNAEISDRDKNEDFRGEFGLSEDDCYALVMNLTVDDFCEKDLDQSRKGKFIRREKEYVYVFGLNRRLEYLVDDTEETFTDYDSSREVEIYIKFNMRVNPRERLFIISLHESEEKIKYYYR